MKKTLLIIAIALFTSIGYAFPLTEGFNEATFPPTDWSLQLFEGTSQPWQRNNFNANMIHSGASSAYAMGGPATAALVSPVMSIPANGEYKLVFWSRVMFLTGTCEVWISNTVNDNPAAYEIVKVLSGTETSDTWSEITIPLTEYAGESIYIAFVFKVTSFSAWAVDDYEVSEISNGPVFEGNASLAMGSVFNNIHAPVQANYSVRNKGGAPLVISEMVSSSPEISIANLPVTIEPNETKTLTVVMDAFTTGVPLGAYTGNFVIATNDTQNEEVTVGITANVTSELIKDFIEENFNTGTLPTGWSVQGGFMVRAVGGIGNSPRIGAELWNTNQYGFVRTSYVEMGNNPELTFNYRAVSNISYPTIATAPEAIAMKVRITKDYGATWDTIYSMDFGEHLETTEYLFKNIDVSDYINEICKVEFSFYHNGEAAAFMADMDDVVVGTLPVNELAAVSINGNAIPTIDLPSTYTIVVRNNGTEAQDQNTYSVKLMQEGDTEIATLPGVAIVRGENKSFEFTYTPDAEGTTYLYGKVVTVPTDENLSNNQTSHLGILVPPEGIEGITIAEGTVSMNLPVNFAQTRSVSQSLYFPHEIGANGGPITGIIYKTRMAEARPGEIIKVWVGETDKTNLLDNGRVDPNTLTLVFDGTIDFPGENGANVVIPFDEPYNYQGGVFVTYVYRPTATPRTGNDLFYGQTIAGSNRSLITGFLFAEIDPMDPYLSMMLSNNVPTITLLMNTTALGTLSGVVSNDDGVIEGAQVKLLDQMISLTTNEAGEYTFPYLTPGVYTLEVTKFGYLTATHEITITAGEALTQNVNLPLRTGFPVSGKVTGSNVPEGLANVTVLLRGYENYMTTTNTAGEYYFPDVYEGQTYEIKAIAEGYINYVSEVEVIDDEVVYDFMMTEFPFPVRHATATISGDNAVISWSAPEAITQFRYDAGTATGQLGFSGGNQNGVFGSCHSVNATLNRMSWFLTGDGGPQEVVNVFVFALNANKLPTNTILYSATNVPTAVGEWSSYEFPEPVNAPNGFYIALSRNSGFLSIGTSNPTEEYPFMPQTHFYTGNYNNLAFNAVESQNYNINFMIRAEGTLHGELIKSPKADAPAPIQYVVYRLEEEEEESAWTELDRTTALTYTDTDWSTLAGTKIYQYAVKAEYVNDNLSTAILTNVLPKDMEVAYVVNLSTNSGDAPAGAVVKLTHQDGNAAHIYIETAESEVVHFPTVWKGVYDISITKEGFEPYSAGDITIDEAGLSHNAVLIEIIRDPFELEVEVNGKTALLTWNNAPYNFSDDMESHSSFAIENIGEYMLYDGDNAPTFTFQDIHYPNMGYTGSYIVMNPSQTTPASNTVAFQPHSGSQYIACFATKTSAPNNDWLILPKTRIVTGSSLKFYAQNFTLGYDVAKFKVGVSVTGTAPNDFTIISAGNYVEAPYGGAGVTASWEQLSYDLSAFAGEEVHVAIICVSNDGTSVLMLDDIAISAPENDRSFNSYTVYLNGEETATNHTETQYTFTNLAKGDYTAGVQSVYGSGVSTIVTIDFEIIESSIHVHDKEMFTIYPNPVTDKLNIETEATILEIKIFDQTGRVVKILNGNNKTIDVKTLSTGHYIANILTTKGISSVKIVKQ